MATISEIGRTEPVSEEQAKAFDRVWGAPGGMLAALREINNIPIAHRYMAVGFAFFLVGGVQALLMRIQLGTPENTFLDAATYNQLFTMHGTTMMFLFVIPFIEALANYMMPLLLGTRDLPFPRLTALSFWTYLFGGVLLYSSFLFGVAPDGGWFAYVPLTNKEYSPGINMDFWDIGLSVAEVAAMGAAAELIISILRMRAPGMTLSRMPLFCWAMLVTAVMIIFAFTPLIVGTAMLEFDRKELTSFFVPEHGGEPLLWQHFFWVFGHPEVYIMFIPAVGLVSQIVQAMSQRSIVGYPLMVLAIVATGFISFGLWVHHMFTTGLSPVAMGFFTAASMMIAIPSGVQMFGWIATLWTGRPQWRTPLLFVIGFIIIFVIGGVTGVMVAAIPFDWQVHDSYFVVAHFHYVLIGGVLFPLIAGLYYWLPKITGRLMSERLGKWNFWTMFIFFNVAFFPMHISGLLGMPRRVYTYPSGLGWEPYNLISTIGAMGFGLGVLLFVVNFAWSLKRGRPAGHNPWNADTLEWSEPSPPPNAQFQFIPEIRSRHPLWEQETLAPQDPEIERLLRPVQSAPTRWRGALVVSIAEAKPVAIVHVPMSTLAPFVTSVGLLFVFAGAIVDALWMIGVGAAVVGVGLIRWFWPRDTERVAIEEVGTEPREGKLRLAVAGPDSNGYWGVMVTLLILATALACLVSSYFYLGEGPESWPPPSVPAFDLTMPLLATVLMLVTGGAGWWTTRSIRRESITGRRVGLAAAFVSVVAFAWVSLQSFTSSGLTARGSAYASIFVYLLGFAWVVAVVLLVMLGVAQLWAWRSPRDRRGDGAAINASLVCYFIAASWLVIATVLYLSPFVW
jgi:cytochrome c oxidase subunit I+III